jgi:hypothetical protein
MPPPHHHRMGHRSGLPQWPAHRLVAIRSGPNASGFGPYVPRWRGIHPQRSSVARHLQLVHHRLCRRCPNLRWRSRSLPGLIPNLVVTGPVPPCRSSRRCLCLCHRRPGALFAHPVAVGQEHIVCVGTPQFPSPSIEVAFVVQLSARGGRLIPFVGGAVAYHLRSGLPIGQGQRF